MDAGKATGYAAATEIDALVARIARERDVSALEQLYRKTSSRLMGLTMRILGDEADCADLLQDLYLNVWQQAHQFSHSGSAWGWLCVMARNAAIDRLRYRRRLSQVPFDRKALDRIESVSAGEAPDPALHRCLAKLRAEQRELLLLSYIHGYSHRELQAMTAQPLGTIKSWIRRGLRELKQCLEH